MSSLCTATAAALLLACATHPGPRAPIAPAVMFLCFAALSLQSSEVSFDKVTRRCTIRRLIVFREIKRIIAFGDINDVRLQATNSDLSSMVMQYRLALVTTAGIVPLSPVYTGGRARYEALQTEILGVLAA